MCKYCDNDNEKLIITGMETCRYSMHTGISRSPITKCLRFQILLNCIDTLSNLIVYLQFMSILMMLKISEHWINDMAESRHGQTYGIILASDRRDWGKTMKNLSKNSQCPGKDSNWATPKYKPEALLFEPISSAGNRIMRNSCDL